VCRPYSNRARWVRFDLSNASDELLLNRGRLSFTSGSVSPVTRKHTMTLSNGALIEMAVPSTGLGGMGGTPAPAGRREAANIGQTAAGLRVCHLAKFYPPARGGIETHVQTLARTQAELGAEVRVVCVNHRDRNGRDTTWDRFSRTETVEERDGPVRLTRVGKCASVARLDVCPDLAPVWRRVRAAADVVHVHAPNPTMTLALAFRPPRVPLVITHHSDVVRQRLLGLAYRPVEMLVYGRAAVVGSDSPPYPEGSALLRRFAAKTRVLPLGIDLSPYLEPNAAARAHSRRLREEFGAPLWLAVGRLVYYKGLQNAMRALRDVPGRLLIIGEGPLHRDLLRQAQALAVADRVTWRGQVDPDELVGAYHAATALWFPSNSRSEGFGLVQVEAMASGCPVINTAVPASGVAWVSRHEETGLTVPVNDPDALAAAARHLLEAPTLRDRLARAARARACGEFDHRLMAARSLELYRQAGAGLRKPARA
jgi:rhamnosyl/mannosyltransferase